MARKFSKYLFNYPFIFCFILLTVNFLFFFIPDSSASTQVTLEWGPNSEPDLAGYRVYNRGEGQSYDYSSPSWEGTETTCTIYDLDETKTYYFVVRAFETEGLESGDSNDVCFEPGTPENQPPISAAGPDQTVDEGQLVTLDGSNSTDPDDGIASYHWVQISGLVQEAEYGVLFGAFETFSDSAASGGQYVQVPNGADISHDVPDEAHKVEYTFDVPEAGIYRIKGWVHAANGADDSFWVRVNGSPAEGYLWDVFQNTSYQADYVNNRDSADPVEVWLEAGENSVSVYLRENGTRLDKIGLEPLGGLSVTLSDPNAQRPTFTSPDVDEGGASLIFELTVVDQGGLESTDSCLVNVTWLNEPPEANAGTDQTVNKGVVVTLDGSSSLDIDDGIASYLWAQISGPAGTLLDPTSFQPTFTAPDVRPEGASLNFNLVVTDAGGLQDTDSCIVNIIWENQSPTAVVAEEYIEANQGALVTLDGSMSTDPDDGIASYLWTQVDGDPVTLSDPTSNVTTFTAPETDHDGSNLTFQLKVTDIGGLQSSANCFVFIAPEINEPPIANAGEDQVVYEDDVVILDGSRSSDPDGGITSYQWTQISGTPVTLAGPTSVLPTFIAPDVGSVEETLTFRLTVTDTGGLQGTDTCSVTVIPEVQTDNVTITSAIYIIKKKTLSIKAVSDAPAGSVTLTVWANYGTESVKLGNLKYSVPKKIYSNTFRKVASVSDTVTVTSGGGGSDTVQCSN